jgi:hypothetical protein
VPPAPASPARSFPGGSLGIVAALAGIAVVVVFLLTSLGGDPAPDGGTGGTGNGPTSSVAPIPEQPGSPAPAPGNVFETDAVAIPLPEGLVATATATGAIEVSRPGAPYHFVLASAPDVTLVELDALATSPFDGWVVCQPPAAFGDLANWPPGLRWSMQCSGALESPPIGSAPGPAIAARTTFTFYAATTDPPVGMYVLAVCGVGCTWDLLSPDLSAVLGSVRWKLWTD